MKTLAELNGITEGEMLQLNADWRGLPTGTLLLAGESGVGWLVVSDQSGQEYMVQANEMHYFNKPDGAA